MVVTDRPYSRPHMVLRFGHGEGTVETPELASSGLGAGDALSEERIREYLPFVQDPLAIFFSGSHTLGWNHAKSDLDVYVVTREKITVDPSLGDTWEIDTDVTPSSVTLLLGTLGPFRSDVEFWLEEQIDQTLARLPSPTDMGAAVNFSENDRELLDKLHIAKPISGAGWLEERQRRLAESRVGFMLAKRSMITSHGLLEDTAGFLGNGDLESGFLAVRAAFDKGVDALLLSAGSLTPQPKWGARRVKKVADPALPFDRYWAIVTLSGYTNAGARAWIEDVARTTHDLLIETAVRVG